MLFVCLAKFLHIFIPDPSTCTCYNGRCIMHNIASFSIIRDFYSSIVCNADHTARRRDIILNLQVYCFRSNVVVARVAVLVPMTAVDLLPAGLARFLSVGGLEEVRALVPPALGLPGNHDRSHCKKGGRSSRSREPYLTRMRSVKFWRGLTARKIGAVQQDENRGRRGAMWIQVRSMDGRKSVRVDRLSKLTKIEDVRDRLVEEFGAETERQRLFYRGKQVGWARDRVGRWPPFLPSSNHLDAPGRSRLGVQ